MISSLKLTCPLKIVHLKRKFRLPTINFQARTVSFRDDIPLVYPPVKLLFPRDNVEMMKICLTSNRWLCNSMNVPKRGVGSPQIKHQCEKTYVRVMKKANLPKRNPKRLYHCISYHCYLFIYLYIYLSTYLSNYIYIYTTSLRKDETQHPLKFHL